MDRRLTLLFGGLFFLIVFGGMQFIWIYDHCDVDCATLLLVDVMVILGSISLVEFLIAREKPLDTSSKEKDNNTVPNPPSNQNRLIWARAIVRVVLSTILLSSSLFVQGTFVILVTGPPIGFGITALVRGIMGWLPALPHQSNSK